MMLQWQDRGFTVCLCYCLRVSHWPGLVPHSIQEGIYCFREGGARVQMQAVHKLIVYGFNCKARGGQ